MGVINAQKHPFRQISKTQRMPETTVVFLTSAMQGVVLRPVNRQEGAIHCLAFYLQLK